MRITVQAYLTARIYDLLHFRRKCLHRVAGNEPGHLFRQAQFVEQSNKPRYSNLSCKNALGIIGHVVVWMLTRTQMCGDGVKVDRQSDPHTMFGVFGGRLRNGGVRVRDFIAGGKLLACDRRHDSPDQGNVCCCRV